MGNADQTLQHQTLQDQKTLGWLKAVTHTHCARIIGLAKEIGSTAATRNQTTGARAQWVELRRPPPEYRVKLQQLDEKGTDGRWCDLTWISAGKTSLATRISSSGRLELLLHGGIVEPKWQIRDLDTSSPVPKLALFEHHMLQREGYDEWETMYEGTNFSMLGAVIPYAESWKTLNSCVVKYMPGTNRYLLELDTDSIDFSTVKTVTPQLKRTKLPRQAQDGGEWALQFCTTDDKVYTLGHLMREKRDELAKKLKSAVGEFASKASSFPSYRLHSSCQLQGSQGLVVCHAEQYFALSLPWLAELQGLIKTSKLSTTEITRSECPPETSIEGCVLATGHAQLLLMEKHKHSKESATMWLFHSGCMSCSGCSQRKPRNAFSIDQRETGRKRRCMVCTSKNRSTSDSLQDGVDEDDTEATGGSFTFAEKSSLAAISEKGSDSGVSTKTDPVDETELRTKLDVIAGEVKELEQLKQLEKELKQQDDKKPQKTEPQETFRKLGDFLGLFGTGGRQPKADNSMNPNAAGLLKECSQLDAYMTLWEKKQKDLEEKGKALQQSGTSGASLSELKAICDKNAASAQRCMDKLKRLASGPPPQKEDAFHQAVKSTQGMIDTMTKHLKIVGGAVDVPGQSAVGLPDKSSITVDCSLSARIPDLTGSSPARSTPGRQHSRPTPLKVGAKSKKAAKAWVQNTTANMTAEAGTVSGKDISGATQPLTPARSPAQMTPHKYFCTGESPIVPVRCLFSVQPTSCHIIIVALN